MSNHQKRLSAPNSWPIERKEETFTTKADAGPHGDAGVPLVVLLRDVLGYVDSRKEARYALEQDSVLVNGDAISDEDRPIGMFDILAFRQREEYYRVFPGEGGRLSLTPIDEEDADSKLGRIVDKSTVPGGKTQLNLHDGGNLLADGDYAAKDSIVVDNETSEIVAHFPYEEGALVTAVAGTHAGEVGTVQEIRTTLGSGSNAVRVETDAGDEFETIEEYVVVIDENFTSDEDATEDAVDDDTETTAPDDVEPTDDSSPVESETEDESESEAADAGDSIDDSDADAEPADEVEEAAAEAVEESAADDAEEDDAATAADDGDDADDGGAEE